MSENLPNLKNILDSDCFLKYQDFLRLQLFHGANKEWQTLNVYNLYYDKFLNND